LAPPTRNSSETGALAIFTICSNNYMAMARVFVASARLHHPEAQIFLCLADKKIESENYYPAECTVVDASELGLPDYHNFVFRYSIMELNTALKPFMFLRLFGGGFTNVLYFDPDIEIYSRLAPILDRLDDDASFTLTPHLLKPNEGSYFPDDIGIMQAGIYNLGFLGAHRNDQTMDVLHWWARRLTYWCISDQKNGVFVDQKFMDLVPGFVDKIAILRESTLNVAYWNLPQRNLTFDGDDFFVDGAPLIFYHFSGFSPKQTDQLSKYTKAFRHTEISPALKVLMERYAAKLNANAMGIEAKREYAFGRFASGTVISEHVRILFRDKYNFWPSNPFETFEAQLHQPILYQRFDNQNSKVSELAWSLRSLNPVLLAPAQLATHEGQDQIVEWFITNAEKYGIDRRVIEPVSETYGNRPPARDVPAKLSTDDADVTVIGYLQLALGIGESGRQLLKSLNHGLDLKASGLALSLNSTSPKIDSSCDQWLVETTKAPVQLFGVNADQMPQVISHLKETIREDAYRIVYPYWELSKFPKEWIPALDSVDEIWAPTRFIQSMLSHVTKKPVLRMPLALDFTPPPAKPRSAFGLPDDAFLFFFSFDYFSFVERKNPGAVLAAFRKAFADRSKYKHVFLVVKSLNSHRVPETHGALSTELQSDPQVIMINQTLSREDTLGLINSSDAVVSLHRGEGLGLLIAEAMVLGKPVIATDYSATTELVSPQTGWPVGYTLVDVKEGEYPFFQGQKWADPDVEHAAWQMLQVYENSQDVILRTKTAKQHIAENYSMQVVSQKMQQRLNTLKNQ
jgi:glycosyltransferase involved in cell wall biosynthesis